VIGQNVNVDGGAVIGDNVKIQNNVSVYSGVTIENDVFLGPSCVLTNVSNPRSQVNRHTLYEQTTLRRGSTVGANATIVCGASIGRYAFVGAGAVVTHDVADYALVVGAPARWKGWMSRHGHPMAQGSDGLFRCRESGFRYRLVSVNELRCLDISEDQSLPSAATIARKGYREFGECPEPSIPRTSVE
jgi:UDP-2-acetamido-3-amino-2,3-dideoxy-glucuronate N-acetyltransferase